MNDDQTVPAAPDGPAAIPPPDAVSGPAAIPAPDAVSGPAVPAGEEAAPERPQAPAGWSVRRAARTPESDSWDLVDGDGDQAGTLVLQYLPAGRVEGVLAVAGAADEDRRRELLAWLTDLLALDEVAGPGGVIHWTTVAGDATDFWRRAPGRRLTGAERDLGVVRGRVEAVLAQLSAQWGVLPDGDLAVDVGSVRVFVAVRLLETTPAVRVFAITNLDVPTDGELPAYLLALNFGLAIGRFSLDRDRGAVWFDHLLAGDEIEESSVARVVNAVAGTADRHDDEIKARFGGRTFREGGSPVEEAAKLPPPGMGGMAGGYL